MWCKQCRQDVPGVPSKTGRTRCLRCGTFFAAEAPAEEFPHVDGVRLMAEHGLELGEKEKPRLRPEFDFDDWDLDPDLRAFKNAQNAFKRAAVPTTEHPLGGSPFEQQWTLHGYPQPTPYAPHYWPEAQPTMASDRGKRASWLAWMIMSLGFMAFACGGVLLAWSFVSGRQDLWNWGMPAAIGGQIALLIGLVLQLERIWQNNRYAVEKLDEVDERLADIKHTQSMMSVNHGSASQAFYSHMAEGASPSLLLADLKGQLDLLAMRLSQRP
jgi:hypothetical protein